MAGLLLKASTRGWNTVERNGTYAAGDVWGCVGLWFSGRWYVNTDAYLNHTRRQRPLALHQQDLAHLSIHQRLTTVLNRSSPPILVRDLATDLER